jgi:hypothetical protein
MPAFAPPPEPRPVPARPPARQNLVPDDAPQQLIPQAIIPHPIAQPPDWSQRFQVLAVTREINGLLSARLKDQKTGHEYLVGPYDGIETFIVTKIDHDSLSVTLVDSQMTPVTLNVRQ